MWFEKSVADPGGVRSVQSNPPLAHSLVWKIPIWTFTFAQKYLSGNLRTPPRTPLHRILDPPQKIIDHLGECGKTCSLPKPLWSASENYFLYWHFRVLFEYNTWHWLFTTYIPFAEFLHECCLENMILIFFFWWYFTVQYQINLTLCPRGKD